MTSYEALESFAAQLERHITSSGELAVKVVVTPTPVKERGVIIKVSVLKSFLQGEPPLIRSSRTLRVRVSVAGNAESMTGLRQALEAIEKLDAFFGQANLRLEAVNDEGHIVGVPNSRIIQRISQEDSFFDSPDSTEVQEVQNDRIVLITIPQGA
ncbi:MAG: hypothetical protein LBD09_05580 [Treponema sp.]|nr:hypothetical protein [Treponema sp.]